MTINNCYLDSITVIKEIVCFVRKVKHKMCENVVKWDCTYCTYMNYPSAIKCTMCGKLRLFQNIYQLSEDDRNQYSSSYCGASASLDNDDALASTPHRIPSTQQQSTIAIDTQLSVTKNLENSGKIMVVNKKSLTNQEEKKWECPQCTYYNYPKTLNCVMCLYSNSQTTLMNINNMLRPKTPSPPPVSLSSVISPSPSPPPQPVTTFLERNIDNINLEDRYQTGIIDASKNNIETEHTKLKSVTRHPIDWNWINACRGVIEGDPNPVEIYLANGGDPARMLTAAECVLLNRYSAFTVGHTLVHLAIRFQRDDLLAILLSQIEETSTSGIKRVPSYVAPDLASDIRRHFTTTIRQKKNSSTFPCYYLTECPTFTLPLDINLLPLTVQDQLMQELLDKDAQEELEAGDSAVINWAIGDGICRLYALWNRSAGDCLLDSLMQATWGVFDRENTLRRALAESLIQAGHVFYPRWKEYESSHASFLQYSLLEGQWKADWNSLVSLATQPGSSLEQLHVFALAHILKRPILVYGVKIVKSFRGEALCPARFEGIYLPLLWIDSSFCSRSPIALGYTRGHFSALVPMEPSIPALRTTRSGALASSLLPLVDRERKSLPIHFLIEAELGREEAILREWMDVTETENGILVAQQPLQKRPLLVAQMCEEWLNHYRRIIQMTSAPFVRPIPIQDYSSEGDTDGE